MSEKKVALVCDWLTNVGGAEKVLLEFHKLFPFAPIYTSQYNKNKINWFDDADVRVGWMKIFPTKLRRFLGPLRQLYFSHLDLSNYDLIISVTGAEAKSIKKGTATHICYCHVPTQYYWQFYDSYVKNPGFGILNPVVRFFFKLFVKPLKKADYKSAQKPDFFITISTYASEMIKKYYDRESTIIFPPVAVENFSTGFSTGKNYTTKKGKSQIFVTTSRQVTWKRLDLAIKACLRTKNHLKVIGEGPEHENLKKLAAGSPLISFSPLMPQKELKTEFENSDAYIFPSLEPFGIAPVEALAAGLPVIAFGAGGALDYIQDHKNGLLFERQTTNSLAETLQKFNPNEFDRQKIHDSALPFSEKYFINKIKDFLNEHL